MNQILKIPGLVPRSTHFRSLLPNVVNVELCATAVCAFLKIDMTASPPQRSRNRAGYVKRGLRVALYACRASRDLY